jgi:hypothetical protein
MNAANTRSKFPSSVVIGQIGVINIILVFIFRWIIAWTAQDLIIDRLNYSSGYVINCSLLCEDV